MAGGWARDGAVQDQIDASIEDAVSQARSLMPDGVSLTHCEDCDETIPNARRKAVPGVRKCIVCQEADDRDRRSVQGMNRRASKDSQLR